VTAWRIPRLARHAGVYVAAPILHRAIYFFLIPVFTHYLSPPEYGAWGYISVAGTMLGTFAPLGLLSSYGFAIRRPHVWAAGAEKVRAASLQASTILVVLLCMVAYPILRTVALGVSGEARLWLLVLSATAGGYLVQAAKRRFQMLELPLAFGWLEIAGGLTAAVTSYLAVVSLNLGVLGLALGMAAGVVAVIVPALWSLRDDLFHAVDGAALREAFVFGFPLFFHTGAAVLLQYIDRFMLERMSGMHQLGLYSLAGQIGTAMTLMATATYQAYLPFMYRTIDTEPQRVLRVERYVALFFVAVALCGVVATPLFIRYAVAPEYGTSTWSAQLLLIGGMFHGFYFLMIARLMAARRTVTIAVTTVLCAALNVLLNLYWIPRRHAEGAAWATLVTEAVLFAAMWYFARRSVPLKGISPRIELPDAVSEV
jgi:O-antigen/teichoic acid export membrane protein